MRMKVFVINDYSFILVELDGNYCLYMYFISALVLLHICIFNSVLFILCFYLNNECRIIRVKGFLYSFHTRY